MLMERSQGERILKSEILRSTQNDKGERIRDPKAHPLPRLVPTTPTKEAEPYRCPCTGEAAV
jgi:hypothetical protein